MTITRFKTGFSLLFCLLPLALAGCSSSNNSSLNMGLAGDEGVSGSGFGLTSSGTHDYSSLSRTSKSRASHRPGRVASHKPASRRSASHRSASSGKLRKSRKPQKLASLKRASLKHASGAKKTLHSVRKKAPVIKIVPVRRLQAKTIKQPALPKLSAISPKNDLKLDLKSDFPKAAAKTAHIEIKPRATSRSSAAKKSVGFTALPIEHKFVQSQPVFSHH